MLKKLDSGRDNLIRGKMSLAELFIKNKSLLNFLYN